MKVEIVSEELSDCRESLSIIINGKEVMSFHDGEPEDNAIYRNFNDVLVIGKYLKLAYEAGLNGESLDLSDRRIEYNKSHGHKRILE